MKVDGATGQPPYRGTLDCLTQTVRGEGPRALFKGLSAGHAPPPAPGGFSVHNGGEGAPAQGGGGAPAVQGPLSTIFSDAVNRSNAVGPIPSVADPPTSFALHS